MMHRLKQGATKKIVRSEQGIALASVMILMTLVAILAASILRLSFLAYERRAVERHSDNNFYAAEGVVDDVQMIIQSTISLALADVSEADSGSFINSAYRYLTTNTSTGLTMIGTNPYDSTNYGNITKGIFDKLDSETQLAIGTENLLPSGTESRGGLFEITGIAVDPSDYTMSVSIHVKYVDEQGYASEIITDIIVRSPIYASSENPPLGSYSMMCGDGAIFKSKTDWLSGAWNQFAVLRQEGNVYIGARTSGGVMEENAVEIKDGAAIEFSGDNVVINGSVTVSGHSMLIINAKAVEIRGTIYLTDHSHLLIGPNCDDLILKDINIDGKGIINTMSGSYVGSSPTLVSSNQYYPLANEITTPGDIQSRIDSTFKSNPNTVSDVLVYNNGAYYRVGREEVGGEPKLYYLNPSNSKIYVSDVISDPSEGVTEKIIFDTSASFKQAPLNGAYDAEVSSIVDVTVLAEYVNQYSGAERPEFQVTNIASVSDSLLTQEQKDDGKLYISNRADVSGVGGSGYKVFQYLKNPGDAAPQTGAGVHAHIGYVTEIENANYSETNPTLSFYVSFNDLEVPMNTNSSYNGIYLSVGKVTFNTQSGGFQKGTSFLSLDKSPGYQYAKEWCQKMGLAVSKWQGDTDQSSLTPGYYRLVNNVFHGGYHILYESLDDSEPANPPAGNASDNTSLDYISTDKWSKE